MKSFKFTKQTSIIAIFFFSFYFAYGLFRLPFVQYLVSLAVGGIVYGITESYEIAVVSLLAMNFLYPVIAPAPAAKKEGFMATNPVEISKRIQGMAMPRQVPVGVGSKLSEGFEDAGQADMTLDQNKKAAEKPAAASAPAPAAPAAPTESFKDAAANSKPGLFKLGEIPTDAKGGYHIDAGTTVINALNALKPDQISAMTRDTKQLIETQKSLMNMLQQFSPMVQEGKQLMDTFNTMFVPTAPQAK